MKNRNRVSQITLVIMLLSYAVVIAWALRYHLLGMPYTTVLQVAMDLFAMAMGIILYIAGAFENKKENILGVWHIRLVVTVYMGMLMDAECWIVEGIPEMRAANIFTNTFLFLANPLVCFEFVSYMIEYLEVKEKPGVKRLMIAMKIGFAIAVAMRIINLFYPVYFSVSEEGVYSRAFLYPLANVYAYGGSLVILGVLFMYRKKIKPYQHIILAMFVLAPVSALVFTMLFYGLTPAFPTMMTVLMTFYSVLNLEKSRARSSVEAELSMATKIQADMLPNLFPAFPERKEFDLYASMNPAKEVGGDFYDFFLIDEDHIGFVMADVSGKGIPAAMFMMFTKNIIANNVMMGKLPAKALRDANDEVCANNTEDMFVTVWLGLLTISTGYMICSSAGHEYPVLKQGDGGFKVFKDKHGMPVGFIDGAEYENYELQFEPGDKLFIYTDGVPEATRGDKEMYGMERIEETLNRDTLATPEQMISHIWEDVAVFVGDAEQFDDLTMLALEYRGNA